VPRQGLAARQQRLAQVGVAPAVADVPLPAGDDLERPVAALVELHGVGDGAGVAVELAGIAQQLHDAGLRLLRGLPGQLGVRGAAGLGGDGLGRLGPQAPVALEHVADRQVELPPPDHVGEVAERAHHGDPGALVALGELVGVHRDLDAEQRGRDGGADEGGVALVVGGADQGDAGGQQLRPGGLDRHGLPPAAGRKAKRW
jgi:hypothetical protein